MKDKNCVYVLTKNDELELPVVVTDTLEEMSAHTGFLKMTLFKACSRNSVIAHCYRIRQVDVRDPEEKFEFNEYAKFCKRENLNPTNFKSLSRFRESCFGV